MITKFHYLHQANEDVFQRSIPPRHNYCHLYYSLTSPCSFFPSLLSIQRFVFLSFLFIFSLTSYATDPNTSTP